MVTATLLWICCLWISFECHSQSGFYFPNEEEQKILMEWENRRESLFNVHLGIRPYKKGDVAAEWFNLLKVDTTFPMSWKYSRYHADIFLSDSSLLPIGWTAPKPLCKYLYTDGMHLFSHYQSDFTFQIDPLVQWSGGYENENQDRLYLNQRGIAMQLSVDHRFGARFQLLETQQSAFGYVHDYEQLYAAFPGAGLYKSYQGRIIHLDRGYDYLLAEGELNYRLSKHVEIALGHGKQFIGFGQRSLFLSDFAPPAFFLKLQTNVWKLNYQNVFAELNAETLDDAGNRLLPKKYMASHVLSINLTKRWNVGLFESVIFARENHFEFQYLNPVILYRFVEQALGSPDNAFVGIQSKYLVNRSLNVYGQLLFDELVLKEFVKGSGWWGNKYGMQLGLQYHEAFGWSPLRLQVEWNLVRPYTYTFRDSVANYSHYHQALAHPLGANFSEWLLNVHYQLTDKMQLEWSQTYFQKGLDDASQNFGGNILKDYDTRIGDENNSLLQGLKQKVWRGHLMVQYKLWNHVYLDASVNFRSQTIGQDKHTSVWYQLGMRMNLRRQTFPF